MRDLAFDLHAAGVLAPGIASLADLRAAHRNEQWPSEAVAPAALTGLDGLPPNERRRASAVVRLTLGCIEQALQASPFPVDALRSVFATDEGSGEICQQMLETLATTRQVSPLLFANSVLNAPSGYFSIARGNRQAATVVSAGSESFAAGLACAVVEATTTTQAVLLVSYDPAMTPPMHELLPIVESTATAWVISSGLRAGAPALGSFLLSIGEPAGASVTPLPGWIPDRWAAQSSATGLAALALLDDDGEAVYRCRLGGAMLALRRLARQ